MSRGNDGILVEYMIAFIDLPIWCAPVGAVVMYVAMAVVPDMLAQHPLNPMELVIIPFLRGLAPWVAGGVLLSGLLGVMKRAVNRWIQRRNAPVGLAVAAGSASMQVPGGTPACPKCGGPTVERTARKGANAGQSFWGCQGYPRCNGVAR